jgi:signal transduction histidine kinase
MIEASHLQPGLSDDFDGSAQFLADEGSRMLPGIDCRITVVSTDLPRTVCISAAAGVSGSRLRGTEWPAERTPTGWTLDTMVPVERSVQRGDPAIAPELIDGPTVAIRAVPLPGSDRPVEGQPNLGAFVVQRSGSEAFSAAERSAIDAYSSLIAVALLRTRAFGEAQASAQEMGAFVDLVVHELRSPLTVIAGYVDLIRGEGEQLDPLRERALGIVSSKVAEMQRLVDELVLSARLSSGQVPAAATPVDLGDAVVKAIERAEPRGRMLDAQLRAEIPPVPCDPSHIDHILDNLINNALSYGGQSPTVAVSVDGERPLVIVADRGPGISAELHERVFDRFFRINPLKGHAGSGLGLFISRKLAEQAGGTLEIDYSEPGKGTRFALRLPAAA